MYLLSIAAARPERVLARSFMEELCAGQALSDVEKQLLSAIEARHTVLPLEYISESCNRNPREAVECADMTPTDIAVAAARKVLTETGVSPDQVGLVLGASATPLQTIPSEAQRVAGALGMKTNAYDINGSTGDLPLMLSSLLKWKEERLPEYILCISTNTPTTRLDYSCGSERFVFGDGAVALLLSPQIRGKARVLAADYATEAGHAAKTRVEVYGHVKVERDDFYSYLMAKEKEMVRSAIVSSELEPGDIYFIDNHYPFSKPEDFYAMNIQPEKHYSRFPEQGCVFSTGPFMTLAECYSDIPSGGLVLVSAAGLGAGSGYTLLRME